MKKHKHHRDFSVCADIPYVRAVIYYQDTLTNTTLLFTCKQCRPHFHNYVFYCLKVNTVIKYLTVLKLTTSSAVKSIKPGRIMKSLKTKQNNYTVYYTVFCYSFCILTQCTVKQNCRKGKVRHVQRCKATNYFAYYTTM